MKIIDSAAEMQALAEAARLKGERIALVPTMGYLHDGHLSLMREGRRRATLLIASIFVNPTQFGPNEDLACYPRDFERDCGLMRTVPVDVVFAPEPAQLYRNDFQTWVEVTDLTKPLCGALRPGHFRGVTTVVAKLFNVTKPHLSLFGAKDFQQLRAVKQMTADLNFDVEIVAMPTVREADGLALSSRNAYLAPAEREIALGLSRALTAARDAAGRGTGRPDDLRRAANSVLERHPGLEVEYLEVLDAVTLSPPSDASRKILVAVAGRVGRTRLIDNVVLEPVGSTIPARNTHRSAHEEYQDR